jgi:hypothetical protein
MERVVVALKYDRKQRNAHLRKVLHVEKGNQLNIILDISTISVLFLVPQRMALSCSASKV